MAAEIPWDFAAMHKNLRTGFFLAETERDSEEFREEFAALFLIWEESEMAKKNFYAVRQGRNPGIYTSWPDCQKQVIGFAGASFKGFAAREEAEEFLRGGESGNGLAGRTTAPDGQTGKASEAEMDPVLLSVSTGSAVAYVDGSYYHGTGEFACGAVLIFQGKEIRFSEKYSDPDLAAMRNVAGEIKGAELVMRYCAEHGIPSLIIFHDYEGIAKWPLGEWQAKKEGTALYKKIYEELSGKVAITFRKVKGHSGNEWNDLADQLAKAALGL